MENKQLVLQWLSKHQSFDIQEVADSDFNHFVSILTDVANCCCETQRKTYLDNMCEYIRKFNEGVPMKIDVESFRKWAERAMEG